LGAPALEKARLFFRRQQLKCERTDIQEQLGGVAELEGDGSKIANYNQTT
jgi:hypothetical protein